MVFARTLTWREILWHALICYIIVLIFSATSNAQTRANNSSSKPPCPTTDTLRSAYERGLTLDLAQTKMHATVTTTAKPSAAGSPLSKELTLKAKIDGMARVTLDYGNASNTNRKIGDAYHVVGPIFSVNMACVDVGELRNVTAVDIQISGGRSSDSLLIKSRHLPTETDTSFFIVDGSYLIGIVRDASGSSKGLSFSYIFLPGVKWMVESSLSLFGRTYTPGATLWGQEASSGRPINARHKAGHNRVGGPPIVRRHDFRILPHACHYKALRDARLTLPIPG